MASRVINKSQRFLILLVSLCILSAITGCSGKYGDVINLDSKGTNIICFGDSITQGVGAREKEDFPFLMSEALKREVINAGKSGDTTESAIKRLKKDVLDRDPWIVIVELGGNDFLREDPKEKTKKNLTHIVREIQKAGAIVVLVGMDLGVFVDEYEDIYETVAEENGAYLIPTVNKGITDNKKYKSDRIHPNAAGYSIIADRLLEELIPLMDEAAK